MAIELTWTNATTVTDPGAGKVNFNNASWTATTRIAISTADRFSNQFGPWLDALNDSTNPNVKGTFRLEKVSNNASWAEFTVKDVLPGGANFRLLDVVFAAQGVAFATNDIVGISSSRAGDKGLDGIGAHDGVDGAPGAAGATTGMQYIFDTSIVDSDPGGGKFRLNNATALSATMMFIDITDVFGSSTQTWLETLDDSDNPNGRSIMEMIEMGNPATWLRIKVTGAISSVTGYLKIPIQVLNVSTVGMGNGDVMAISSALAGPIGPIGPQGIQGDIGPSGAAGPPVDPAAFTGTSTTLLTIGTGYKVWVTELDKVWTKGQRLRCASADAAKVMEGAVSEYHPETGSLTLSVDLTLGSGSHNEWYISIAGERGIDGPPGVQGSQGSTGSGLKYDASGTLAQRAAYDTMPQGFAYLQTDVTPFVLFVKASATTADWSSGTPIESPTTLAEIVPTGALQLDAYDSILAAATTDLGTITSNLVDLAGTASITSFGTAAEGVFRLVRVSGTPTLVYNGATMILPGGASIACLSNDSFMAMSRGSGVWQVLWYARASVIGAGVELEDILPIGAIKYAAWLSVISAATTDLGAQNANFLTISGSTTIGSFGTAAAGIFRYCRLTGAPSITHSVSLLLPGAANIQGAIDDRFMAVSLGAGNWIVMWYERASGGSLLLATTTELLTGTNAVKTVTPDAAAALWEKGPNIASAATLVLTEGGYFHITGTVTITDIDFAVAKDGRAAWVVFDGILTLTHNATTLILPGGQNIVTAVGDRALFVQDVTDNVICLAYVRAASVPLVAATTTEVLTGTDAVKAATPDAIAALWEKGTTVPSAATVVLPEGGFFHISGTVTITDIDWSIAKDGRWAWLYFDAALTLTHNATTLVLFGSNIVTVAGDTALFVQDAADNVICLAYHRASGKALVPPTAAEVPFTPTGNVAATTVQAAIAEVATENLGWRNRIINGDFAVDQRNAGAAGAVAAGAGGVYVVDRWRVGSMQAPGAFSVQRVADATYLGEYDMLVAVSAADAALAVGDLYFVGQVIEGVFSKDFFWGNAQAQTITISFEINCSIAATLPVSVRNGAPDRSWLGSFSVSAGVWTKVTLTVPGDVAGTWSVGSAGGVYVQIGLGVGTTYQGVAGWQAGNMMTLPAMTNFVAAANTLYLRRFQVELGTVATEFERVPYDEQLARCMRYYEASAGGGPQIFSGNVTSAVNYYAVTWFKASKRITPTVALVNFNANSFAAAAGTATAFPEGFREVRAANATGNGAFFMSNWTAAAEL